LSGLLLPVPSRNIALGFADNRTLHEIILDDEYGSFIEPYSEIPTENEVLLPPMTVLEIMEVHRNHYGCAYYLKLKCKGNKLEVENDGDIFDACFSGNLKLAEKLLSRSDADVNAISPLGGGTPAILACSTGHNHLLERILAEPRADLTIPNSYGQTPLWVAASEGNERAIELLIASGKELALHQKSTVQTPECPYLSATEVALAKGFYNCLRLLQRLEHDPEGIRSEIRKKITIPAASLTPLSTFFFLEKEKRKKRPIFSRNSS